MSIKDILDKIKSWSFGLSLVLVGSLFFALGRLGAISARHVPIKVEGATLVQASSTEVATLTTASTSDSAAAVGEVFASKRGKKYYYSWCGADTLNAANKISFPTVAAAEQAGYTPSAGCK